MSSKVSTFLMFEAKAEEAMNLYVSLFKDAKVHHVQRFGPGEGGPEGALMRASFTLNGQQFMCFNSPVKHAFTFTPATSIFVDCDSEAEVDALHAKLSEGAQVLMPLGEYPFSKKFVWLNDRYGVSWQLSLMTR